MVKGDRIRMLRHAREIVCDMRWLGMTVPPIYTSMTEEFQALVRSGAYAAWVATFGKGARYELVRDSRGVGHEEPRPVSDGLG
jgi:hypothetical protein